MKSVLPSNTKSPPLLILAPMEGVVDWATRDLFSKQGGIDLCVTEFIRVTDRAVPDDVFYRYSPELRAGCTTLAGTPVLIQLLGGDASALADSAARAAELGAYGIDLNFGCPAKTVNRHDGGAALLKSPERIEKIVTQVRKSVPADISVSVKMRLGFEDPEMCLINAQAANAGGASWLTVHCRTKLDMYKPPAYWEWIPKITQVVSIPVVANGEIWTLEDYWRCREISGSQHIMIGRGALADPFLFRRIKMTPTRDTLPQTTQSTMVSEISPLLKNFYESSENYRGPAYAVARTKQWLRQLSLRHADLIPLFEQLKVLDCRSGFKAHLFGVL